MQRKNVLLRNCQVQPFAVHRRVICLSEEHRFVEIGVTYWLNALAHCRGLPSLRRLAPYHPRELGTS